MKRIALLAGVLALLAAAPAAAQDSYTVHYCQSPSGGPATTEGLTALSGHAALHRGCPAQGLATGPATATVGLHAYFGIRYSVPADTRLAGFVLYRAGARGSATATSPRRLASRAAGWTRAA